MFERDQLRDEFTEILQQQQQIATKLNHVLKSLDDAELRQRFVEMQQHNQRHVELTERLVEIVS